VTRIEGRTAFARAQEEMFDFLADPRNEPAYNARILSARKVTPGPIGLGTRFVQRAKAFGGAGDVTIDLVDCQRPRHLTWRVRSAGMDIRGDEGIISDQDRTEVHWVWEFQPRGSLRLLGPLLGLAGRTLEHRVWTDMKRYVETAPPWHNTAKYDRT
jgi:hypothetical protein